MINFPMEVKTREQQGFGSQYFSGCGTISDTPAIIHPGLTSHKEQLSAQIMTCAKLKLCLSVFPSGNVSFLFYFYGCALASQF